MNKIVLSSFFNCVISFILLLIICIVDVVLVDVGVITIDRDNILQFNIMNVILLILTFIVPMFTCKTEKITKLLVYIGVMCGIFFIMSHVLILIMTCGVYVLLVFKNELIADFFVEVSSHLLYYSIYMYAGSFIGIICTAILRFVKNVLARYREI